MKGLAIVRAFTAEHGIDVDTLGRHPKELRADLIRQLKDSGLNNSEISRVTNIDRTTVRYWLSGQTNQWKIRSSRCNRADYHFRKISRWWEQCASAIEAHS